MQYNDCNCKANIIPHIFDGSPAHKFSISKRLYTHTSTCIHLFILLHNILPAFGYTSRVRVGISTSVVKMSFSLL